MTAAPPLARYSAVEDALASGFAIAELHHHWGHDPAERVRHPSYGGHKEFKEGVYAHYGVSPPAESQTLRLL